MLYTQGIRKYLSEPEREAFLRAAIGFKDSKKRAFALVMYYSGARISEILALLVGRIDYDVEGIVIRSLKQRSKTNYRFIIMPPEVLALLRYITMGKKTHERVFDFSRTTGWRVIKEIMKQVELEGSRATPKGLRHSYAVAHVSKTTPVNLIQKWLGHRHLSSTVVYMDFVSEEEIAYAKSIWPKKSRLDKALLDMKQFVETVSRLFL